MLEDATDTISTEEFVHDLLDEQVQPADIDSDADLPDPIPEEDDTIEEDSYETNDVEDLVVELSPALNAIDSSSSKTPTLVCYAKVNHGVCSNKECKYSHDDVLINKFKAQYKERQQQKKGSPGVYPTNNNNKPMSTPQRKLGADNKRRA